MSICIIGVTGPSGAGKSSLCGVAEKMNIPYIDADKVYHSLLIPGSECTRALVAEFGAEILSEDGSPDRRVLSAIVFSSEEKLQRLNKIVLSLVTKEIEKMISELERDGNSNVIVDAPTLIESGFNRRCDAVISVLSPKEQRLRRICERDNIPEDRAMARLNAQQDDSFYVENSDFLLINDGDIERFCREALDLLDTITKN